MNAKRHEPVSDRHTGFFDVKFQKPAQTVAVSSAASYSSQEIAMASSPTRHRLSRLAFAAASIAAGSITAIACVEAAFASQGPGVGMGTASNFTQLAMAIIVYGSSALIVGAGLIGAARRR
jgi:hypothetical protein